MNDRMAYDFDEIDLGVRREIHHTATRFNTALAELRRRIAPLQQSWTRQAADAYRLEQADWDRAAGALNDLLFDLATAVRGGSIQVADADRLAAGGWRR